MVTPPNNARTGQTDLTLSANTAQRFRHLSKNRDNRQNIFKGKIPKVGAVIGRKGEGLSTKETYRNFIEQLRRYVKINITPGGKDLVFILDNLWPVEKNTWAPEDTTDDKAENRVQMEKWKMAIKGYHDHTMQCLEENSSQLYDIIYGQCTSRQLQTNLKTLPKFKDMHTTCGVVALLSHVKLQSLGVEQKTQDPYKATFFLLKGLSNLQQGKCEGCDTYATKFRDYLQTLQIAGAEIFAHPSLQTLELLHTILEGTRHTTKNATDAELTKAKHISTDRYQQAVCLLENADARHYSPLLSSLQNDVVTGHNKFSTSVTRCYELLSKWGKSPVPSTNQ